MGHIGSHADLASGARRPQARMPRRLDFFETKLEARPSGSPRLYNPGMRRLNVRAILVVLASATDGSDFVLYVLYAQLGTVPGTTEYRTL